MAQRAAPTNWIEKGAWRKPCLFFFGRFKWPFPEGGVTGRDSRPESPLKRAEEKMDERRHTGRKTTGLKPGCAGQAPLTGLRLSKPIRCRRAIGCRSAIRWIANVPLHSDGTATRGRRCGRDARATKLKPHAAGKGMAKAVPFFIVRADLQGRRGRARHAAACRAPTKNLTSLAFTRDFEF